MNKSGLKLSSNAVTILQRRYLVRDAKGKIAESPLDMFKRVARHIAAAELLFDRQADAAGTEKAFFDMLRQLRFLPNSPTMMNAGTRLGQLAACFVLPINDSMDSIFETLKNTAIIHKSGGGTGFSFSNIRPENDVVLSTAGVSSGPVSFMGVFDTATETVKQGGARRGANMAVLRVDHPDIHSFIHSKDDPHHLNNFNISVGLTDDFMAALEKNAEYDLVNPRTMRSVASASARNVFSEIVRAARNTGEPGIVFIDRMERKNPTPRLGRIEATNPCGEQPLLPYESCTLGSVNLSEMVIRGKISFSRLKKTVHTAVHFLDNVIEANRYPLKLIEKASKGTRKIGLGVMGFADMLIKLGVAYESMAAVEQAETVMTFIRKEARAASAILGKKRGNFEFFKTSIYDTPDTPTMRNATTTTIAPTGSISLIAGTSSGIEPIFAVAHRRQVLDGERLTEVHPLFITAAKSAGGYSKDLMEKIAETGSVQSIPGIPDQLKNIFKNAHEISPEWHIRVQAAFQKHTDNAVSKTVNFPATADDGDVEKTYLMAYRLGCKGVTIYRYGSRDNQVLQIGQDSGEDIRIAPRPRPERTRGVTERVSTGCGKLYVTVNSDREGMCEVFAQMGKTGGCASSQIEAAGRLISLALRSGVKPDAVIKQLTGIRCPSPAWQNGDMVLSCPDAIARVLKNVCGADIGNQDAMMGVCPDCSGVLTHEEGCLICRNCGYSKCG